MGSRKITVKQSAAESIATVAWYIESKGLVKTAEKFADDVYTIILLNRHLTRECIRPQKLGLKSILSNIKK